MKRRILISLGVVGMVAVLGSLIVLWIGLVPFAERKRDADRTFLPLVDLRPVILDNAFGVYCVTFDSDSLLTDDNASRLLGLNDLPGKYDLTLVLKTDRVTDASIPILSRLRTTDVIVAHDSALTDAGIFELASALPDVRVPLRKTRDWVDEAVDKSGP